MTIPIDAELYKCTYADLIKLVTQLRQDYIWANRAVVALREKWDKGFDQLHPDDQLKVIHALHERMDTQAKIQARVYPFRYVDYLGLVERNNRQAGRIMELEFDLRRYMPIMVEDRQESLVSEIGVPEGNVVPLEEFRRLRAKKGGGNGTGDGDWLIGMEWGSEFYVRPKRQKTWLLAKFMMAGVRGGVVLVIPMRGDEPVTEDKDWMWVDPIEFCKYFDLMAVMKPQKESSNE